MNRQQQVSTLLSSDIEHSHSVDKTMKRVSIKSLHPKTTIYDIVTSWKNVSAMNGEVIVTRGIYDTDFNIPIESPQKTKKPKKVVDGEDLTIQGAIDRLTDRPDKDSLMLLQVIEGEDIEYIGQDIGVTLTKNQIKKCLIGISESNDMDKQGITYDLIRQVIKSVGKQK